MIAKLLLTLNASNHEQVYHIKLGQTIYKEYDTEIHIFCLLMFNIIFICFSDQHIGFQ